MPGTANTHYVSTRWYRAPECLLNSRYYGKPTDVFALGCILAEFMKLKPIFTGASSADQLHKYCAVLGTPSVQEWPEGYKLAQSHGLNFPKAIGSGL